MAISDEQHSIKIVGTYQIKKDLKRRKVNTLPSSKYYRRIFDKRVRNTKNHTSLPFVFLLSSMYVLIICHLLYN